MKRKDRVDFDKYESIEEQILKTSEIDTYNR